MHSMKKNGGVLQQFPPKQDLSVESWNWGNLAERERGETSRHFDKLVGVRHDFLSIVIKDLLGIGDLDLKVVMLSCLAGVLTWPLNPRNSFSLAGLLHITRSEQSAEKSMILWASSRVSVQQHRHQSREMEFHPGTWQHLRNGHTKLVSVMATNAKKMQSCTGRYGIAGARHGT